MSRTVWLVDHAPIMGGAEAFVLKLARRAAQRPDLSAVVACPGDSELARVARGEGLAVRALPMPHVAGRSAALIPAAVARLARALRTLPPDAVVVPNSAWSQALVAAAAPLSGGRRVVHVLHEQETARRLSARIVLRRVGVPLAIGANAAAAYSAALGTPVPAVANVLGEAELAAAATAAARTGTRDRRSPPIVGVLARFIPEKGLLELVDELDVAAGSWAQLRLAGEHQDAVYVERVRAAAARLGDPVRIEDHVADVAGFLDAVDVLVVPSTGNEGQPTVILEALARGVPVVVRASLHSTDYAELPVLAYRSGIELAAALAGPLPAPADLELVRARFGADQALDAVLAAAGPGTRSA